MGENFKHVASASSTEGSNGLLFGGVLLHSERSDEVVETLVSAVMLFVKLFGAGSVAVQILRAKIVSIH